MLCCAWRHHYIPLWVVHAFACNGCHEAFMRVLSAISQKGK
jgi:hypothetical protein